MTLAIFFFNLVLHFHYYTFYTPINLLPSFTVKNSCVGLMSKDACGSELASVAASQITLGKHLECKWLAFAANTSLKHAKPIFTSTNEEA